MIRKPKRINVRFSETEYAELLDLFKFAKVWDMTSLVRNALAHYRRHVLEKYAEPTKPVEPKPRQAMPALSDKDKRASKSKAAAKVSR